MIKSLAQSKKGLTPHLVAIFIAAAFFAVAVYSESQAYETTVETGQLHKNLVEAYSYGEQMQNYLDYSTKSAVSQSIYDLGELAGYEIYKNDAGKDSVESGGCGVLDGYPVWYDETADSSVSCIPGVDLVASKFRNSILYSIDAHLSKYPSNPWVYAEDFPLSDALDFVLNWHVDLRNGLKVIGAPAINVEVSELESKNGGEPTASVETSLASYDITFGAMDEFGSVEDAMFVYKVQPHVLYDDDLDIAKVYGSLLNDLGHIVPATRFFNSETEGVSNEAALNDKFTKATDDWDPATLNFQWSAKIADEDESQRSVVLSAAHKTKNVLAFTAEGLKTVPLTFKFGVIVKRRNPSNGDAVVGKSVPNFGLINLEINPWYPKIDTEVELVATVANVGGDPQTVSVNFFRDGDPIPIGSATVTVPAGETKDASIKWVINKLSYSVSAEIDDSHESVDRELAMWLEEIPEPGTTPEYTDEGCIEPTPSRTCSMWNDPRASETCTRVGCYASSDSYGNTMCSAGPAPSGPTPCHNFDEDYVSCVNALCIWTNEIPTCSDSDGEDRGSVKGEVTTYDDSHGVLLEVASTDYCSSAGSKQSGDRISSCVSSMHADCGLEEQICLDGAASSETVLCDFGCMNGECAICEEWDEMDATSGIIFTTKSGDIVGDKLTNYCVTKLASGSTQKSDGNECFPRSGEQCLAHKYACGPTNAIVETNTACAGGCMKGACTY